MSIGDRIRARRIELNMTQDELAQKLGYKSRTSINKIELGNHNLTQSKIKAIADALETTPSYIMGWEDYDKGVDTAKLAGEVEIFEQIEKHYGKEAVEAFASYIELSTSERAKFAALVEKYSHLDGEDRLIFVGRVFQIVEDMYAQEKYSRKEGCCGAKGI